MKVNFGPKAREQLLRLYDNIADTASPEIAENFIDAIVDYGDRFATFPKRGTSRDDLRPGLRLVDFRRRVVIAFTVDGDEIHRDFLWRPAV